MRVFDFKSMLIELTFLYPSNDDPVTPECCDLRSEMLFSIFRDAIGELMLRAASNRIPLDLIPIVAEIAERELEGIG